MAIKMFLDRGISPYIGESAVLQQTERKKCMYGRELWILASMVDNTWTYINRKNLYIDII